MAGAGDPQRPINWHGIMSPALIGGLTCTEPIPRPGPSVTLRATHPQCRTPPPPHPVSCFPADPVTPRAERRLSVCERREVNRLSRRYPVPLAARAPASAGGPAGAAATVTPTHRVVPYRNSRPDIKLHCRRPIDGRDRQWRRSRARVAVTVTVTAGR